MGRQPTNAELGRGLKDVRDALKELSLDLKPIPVMLERHEGELKACRTLANENKKKIDGFGNKILASLSAAVLSLLGILLSFINPK